jgi:hypothetical protein
MWPENENGTTDVTEGPQKINVPTSKERNRRSLARGRDYLILTCIVIAVPEVPPYSDGLQRIRFTPGGLASTSTRWPVWLTCLGSRLSMILTLRTRHYRVLYHPQAAHTSLLLRMRASFNMACLGCWLRLSSVKSSSVV